MSKSNKKVSFNENYKKLVEISEELRSQQEPDIDKMVEMVKVASDAYIKCKQRLDDVENAIKVYIPKDEVSEDNQN